MNFCVCDTRTNKYLIQQHCAHTKRGFMLEYIMGDWRQALRMSSTEAHGVAVAMWPIGCMQANPYAVEEVSDKAKTA